MDGKSRIIKLLTGGAVAMAAAVPAPAPAVPIWLNHQGRIVAGDTNFDGVGFFKFALVDEGTDQNLQAEATATVSGGRVASVSVTRAGSGYVEVPDVRITDLTGSGATAQANLSRGRVASITVLTTGSGYSSRTEVTIDPPTAPPVFRTLWSHNGSSQGGGEPTNSINRPVSQGHYSVGLGDPNQAGMTEPIDVGALTDEDDVRLRIWFSATGGASTFEQLVPDQKIGAGGFALGAAMADSVKDGAIGIDQLAPGAVTGDKIADGSISAAKLVAPGTEQVLVSDGEGNAKWLSLDAFLLSQNYNPPLPGAVENLADLEIAGVMTDTVEIVNGPGIAIEKVETVPSFSGLNTEYSLVFDYDGSETSALQAWAGSLPDPRDVSIIVRNAGGTERYRWNLYEVEPTEIDPGGGNNGKNRYTLTHVLPPDNNVAIERVGNWFLAPAPQPGEVKVEIDGIASGMFSVPVIDETAKTLTLVFDYFDGNGIWNWTEQIAENGSFEVGNRAISLIYIDNSGFEIGRNNFFECFPVQYQQFTGFGLDTKGQERIVISYDIAQNSDGSALPLYSYPAVEFFPGDQNVEVPYDLGQNQFDLEIAGILTGTTTSSDDHSVLVSGPGFEVERIAGFGGNGLPDDHSGNNREFPLIYEVGGADLNHIVSWHDAYEADLPDWTGHPRALSVIIPMQNGDERFRWNLFEMIPYDVELLPSGRGRVTLYSVLPPDPFLSIEYFGLPWGDGLLNNPATDTFVEIAGATSLHAEVTDDPAERTLTMFYTIGEGGSIFPWARQVALEGTTSVGKSTAAVHFDGQGVTSYHGCFPIVFQHVSGFEQDIKVRVKVVLSYDFSSTD